MNFNLVLNIIASVLIVSQFMREYVGEADKRKVTLSKIVLILALIAFWGSYFIQKNDSDKQEENIAVLLRQSKQDSILISEQRGLVMNLKNQNDSLHSRIGILQELLGKTNDNIDEGFNENQFYLENIKDKVGSKRRFISESQKQTIVQIMGHNGNNFSIPILCSQSEPLNCEYAHQLKYIFVSCGYKSWVKREIGGYSNLPDLKGIVLIIKDNNYPKQADTIYAALKRANLDVDLKTHSESKNSFVIFVGD